MASRKSLKLWKRTAGAMLACRNHSPSWARPNEAPPRDRMAQLYWIRIWLRAHEWATSFATSYREGAISARRRNMRSRQRQKHTRGRADDLFFGISAAACMARTARERWAAR